MNCGWTFSFFGFILEIDFGNLFSLLSLESFLFWISFLLCEDSESESDSSNFVYVGLLFALFLLSSLILLLNLFLMWAFSSLILKPFLFIFDLLIFSKYFKLSSLLLIKSNNFYNIVVEGINKGKSILEKSEQDMNFVKVNINEFEREYLLEEAQEELSISSFESFKTENINKDKHKELLKNIERKLNLNNITFKGYIDDGEYEKNSLKDISDKYEKIKRNLKRINIFLGGEENKNING